MAKIKSELLRTAYMWTQVCWTVKQSVTAKINGKNAYEGKPGCNEQKGKSAIISRDVKKQSEWQHASTIDHPFCQFWWSYKKCIPILEDVSSARQNELLLNTSLLESLIGLLNSYD